MFCAHHHSPDPSLGAHDFDFLVNYVFVADKGTHIEGIRPPAFVQRTVIKSKTFGVNL